MCPDDSPEAMSRSRGSRTSCQRDFVPNLNERARRISRRALSIAWSITDSFTLAADFYSSSPSSSSFEATTAGAACAILIARIFWRISLASSVFSRRNCLAASRP